MRRASIGLVVLLAVAAFAESAQASATPTATPTPTPTAMPSDQLTAQKVPVLGSTTLRQDMDGTKTKATLLVNGVRRIPGATVLYYSTGLSEGARPEDWYKFNSGATDRNIAISSIGNVRLVDFSGEKIYTPLHEDDGSTDGTAMTSPYRSWPNFEPGGTFYTFFAVMPELPEDLDTVDVLVGHGDVVQNVPISDGVMEPTSLQVEPIRMGEAWPQIDQAAAASSLRPQDSVRPLTTTIANADGTVTQESTDETTTVNLSSDVLFEVDSATLDPSAAQVLQKAADAVNSSAGSGEIEIVGHTDSSGSDEHNLKLSRRRAQAVARVLKPLITVSGVTYRISGRGEQDPVGGNDTEAGRKKNRRVGVVFGQEGSK